MAGHLVQMGHKVSLYDIDVKKINDLKKIGGIQLCSLLKGFSKIDCITANIEEAVRGAKIIMVTTVANAHCAVAK